MTLSLPIFLFVLLLSGSFVVDLWLYEVKQTRPGLTPDNVPSNDLDATGSDRGQFGAGGGVESRHVSGRWNSFRRSAHEPETRLSQQGRRNLLSRGSDRPARTFTLLLHVNQVLKPI